MRIDAGEQVTRILRAAEDEGSHPAEALLPVLYDELRGLARAKMRHEPADHTLTATALVHEAYLRLVKDPEARWKSRGHFFAAAAEAMRRILVERARRVAGPQRGGGRRRLAIDAQELTIDMNPVEMLAIDDALEELKRLRPRTYEVTRIRYFAGLTVEEAAAALDISPRTAQNEWRFARAWLFQRLGEGQSQPATPSDA